MSDTPTNDKPLTARQKELLLPKWKRRRLRHQAQRRQELAQGYTERQFGSWMKDLNSRY